MPHPPGFESIVEISHKGYDYGKSGNGNKIGNNDSSYLSSLIIAFWRSQDVFSRKRNHYENFYAMRAEFGGRAEIAPINRKCERGTTTLKCDLSGKPLKFGGGKCGVKTKGLSAKAKTVIQAGDAMRTGAAYYHGETLASSVTLAPKKQITARFIF